MLLNLRGKGSKTARERAACFCKSNKTRQAYFCRKLNFGNLVYFASPSLAYPAPRIWQQGYPAIADQMFVFNRRSSALIRGPIIIPRSY
jgi:hypothetical protein